MAEERRWYAHIGGEQRGPMSSEELKRLASTGKIDRTSLLWADGMPDWAEAGSVKGLFQGPPPVQQAKPQQRVATSLAPHRTPIREYEIAFDRRKLMATSRKLLYVSLIPIGLLSLNFLLWIFGAVDDRRTGPWIMVGPIALAMWPIAWRAINAYWMALKYAIVNDVLTVTDARGTTRIPLARITDVRVQTIKDFEQIAVQTAGSHRPEAILYCVSDPDKVTEMLLSKQP